MGNNTMNMSEEEIINYLKRSHLPTILVEGKDDVYLYRILEEKYNNILSDEDEDIDILPCHNKPTLLKIFDRRSEFAGKKVIFIADQDMWIFTGIPNQYKEDIIFTKGYSIENDLYIKDVENLLSSTELQNFCLLIQHLSRWFAYQVQKYKENGYSECGIHINQIFSATGFVLLDKIEQKIIDDPPPQKTVDEIHQEYNLKIRGKNIFQALIRFLSHKNRGKSKYSHANLYEMGANFSNPNFENMAEKIRDKFKSYSKSI